MASEKEAETLRKQIDVLSNLIHSHKQLKDTEKDTKNYKCNNAKTKNKSMIVSKNTCKYSSSKQPTNFALERRKQQFSKSLPACSGTSASSRKVFHVEANKDIIPSNLSQNSTDKTSKGSTVAQNVNSKSKKVETATGVQSVTSKSNDVDKAKSGSTKTSEVKKTNKPSMEAALLSARLSSLSSSIASAKSKLQANNNAKLSSKSSSSTSSSIVIKSSLPSSSLSSVVISTRSIRDKPKLQSSFKTLSPVLTSSIGIKPSFLLSSLPKPTSASSSSTIGIKPSLLSSSSTYAWKKAESKPSTVSKVSSLSSKVQSRSDSKSPSTKSQTLPESKTKSSSSSSKVVSSGTHFLSSALNKQSKPSLASSAFSWNRTESKSRESKALSSSPSKLVLHDNKTSQTLSKSSAFSWKKKGTEQSNIKTTSVPATASKLKWSKDGPSKGKSLPIGGSKHVWRAKGSLKIDRRKRNSAGLSSGFIRRRQKVVGTTTSSRYHFVSSRRRKSSEKPSKVKIIEGETSRMQKQSLLAQKFTPKKFKQKSSKLLNISGNKYLMNASRKTLKRVHPEVNQPSTSTATSIPAKRRSSLTKVVLSGVTFIETAPGVLVRSGPGKRSVASQKRLRSVQNAILYKYKKKAKSNQYCMFYNRFGKCNKGDDCPYIHDPSKIAVCTKFLKGQCSKTDGSCPFSHKIDKDKMPVCQFFLQDTCTNEDCPYSHVHVSSNAAVCQDFVKGYCPLGQQCKKKHIVNCEEFMRSGKCSKGKKCNLMHRTQKTRKRKRQPSAKDDKPTQAKQSKVVMTEEEGFLPLETLKSAEHNTDETSHDTEAKEQAKNIPIKPRFPPNNEDQG